MNRDALLYAYANPSDYSTLVDVVNRRKVERHKTNNLIENGFCRGRILGGVKTLDKAYDLLGCYMEMYGPNPDSVLDISDKMKKEVIRAIKFKN